MCYCVQCQLDYKQTYQSHCQTTTHQSYVKYVNAHNTYVKQLQATNAILETYHVNTVPQLMHELEEIHCDIFNTVLGAMQNVTDVIVNKVIPSSRKTQTNIDSISILVIYIQYTKNMVCQDNTFILTCCVPFQATDQAKRYENILSECAESSPAIDLTNFVSTLPVPTQTPKFSKYKFIFPHISSEYTDSSTVCYLTLFNTSHSTL